MNGGGRDRTGPFDRAAILNAWRAAVGDRLMREDVETAQMMAKLTTIVVDFTDRVLGNEREDLDLQMARLMAATSDADWPDSFNELNNGFRQLNVRETEREVPTRRRDDDYDQIASTHSTSTPAYAENGDSEYDPYEYEEEKPRSSRIKTFKPSAKQRDHELTTLAYFDMTPYDQISATKHSRLPFVLFLCGKWPFHRIHRNLRVFRFLEHTPSQIRLDLEEMPVLDESVQSIIFTSNTQWMRKKHIVEIQSLFELIHRQAPRARIRVCGFYTPPLQPFAPPYNSALEQACRPYPNYTEYVNMDDVAERLSNDAMAHKDLRYSLENLLKVVVIETTKS